jgi:hypothetical protein
MQRCRRLRLSPSPYLQQGLSNRRARRQCRYCLISQFGIARLLPNRATQAGQHNRLF